MSEYESGDEEKETEMHSQKWNRENTMEQKEKKKKKTKNARLNLFL